MIVARIRRNKKWVGKGSCHISGYNGKDTGWFPVESFNFGFTDDKADEEKQGQGGGQPAKGAPAAPPAKGGQAGGKKKGDNDFAELSIDKQIDTATCQLMQLAMEERKTRRKKGPGAGPGTGGGGSNAPDIEADIHILSTVQLQKDSQRFIYPTVMIHLEAVNILGWNVKASGDGRPSESLKIRYDRAAMIYVAMETQAEGGATWQRHGPAGWDQTKNDVFSSQWPESAYKEFLPPLCTVYSPK
jgi:hypothetical protein